VSLHKLRQQGYWWDQRDQGDIIRHHSGNPICTLSQHWDQYIMEYRPGTGKQASFAVKRARFNTWTEKKPNRVSAIKWHRRLGHPGPRALEHLVQRVRGARIKGITTVECDTCGIAKMKRQERREPREEVSRPGVRVSIDFHDFERGLGGYTSVAIITDRATGYTWDYYFEHRRDHALLTMMKNFVRIERSASDPASPISRAR
jgi:hypothetical protein